ncbi:ComF family protein [Parahaliea mediterranea]|uniref:ComF family protein n=1 Tax=Parahaliea mediterranea TaxID=651086 RepID=A0A939IL04_9GAMM|nr:ComF family protein [Parahaliea mediterranea]MBN7797881.1 ComF family protein [Parahaliea mediterranea]
MNEVLNGLFPQYCLLCGLASHHRLPLCGPCRDELPRNTLCCPQCALPRGAGVLCGRCLAAPPPFDSALAPYLYDEQLALLVQRWKYHPDPRLARLMAALWLDGVARRPLPEVDLVLPVPLHWRKLLQRGFNQAGQLCAGLCAGHPALAGLPPRPGLLRRRRATAVQAGLDARQRRGNLRGAFTLRERCDNLRIALVDDVMTTGATAGEVARCLKSGGAREVHLWCLARTPAPPD